MALKVKWTKRAERSFGEVLFHLEEKFGENTTQVFVKKAFSLVEVLQNHPEIGSIEIKERGIRSFSISKQNRLFYRVSKNQLILLNFFSSRKDPKKKRLK